MLPKRGKKINKFMLFEHENEDEEEKNQIYIFNFAAIRL